MEREIYDQPHSYEIHLRANDFLQLEVESKGREVSMALFRPDGAVLFQRNPWGTERFVEIASAHGVYRLELRALQAGARYRLAVTELHPATERDSKRLAAQNAFKNGEQLSAKSTKDSLKKAIASFDEALALWQAAGEETGIGSTGLEAVAISPDGSMFGYGRTDATMVLAANPFTALLQPDDR